MVKWLTRDICQFAQSVKKDKNYQKLKIVECKKILNEEK